MQEIIFAKSATLGGKSFFAFVGTYILVKLHVYETLFSESFDQFNETDIGFS